MSTLGWFVCLCACLAVGCAERPRKDTNGCIDETGYEHQVGDLYESKCGYCYCEEDGRDCETFLNLCGIPWCGENGTIVYDDPEACCPYCAPDSAETVKRNADNADDCDKVECDWPICGQGFRVFYDDPDACCPYCVPEAETVKRSAEDCGGIECGWPLCSENGKIVIDDPDSCCPYCVTQKMTAKRQVDKSCDPDACPQPLCARDSIYIDDDPEECCPYCLRLEISINDDPCYGIQCDIPRCGDLQIVYDDPDSCCPYCKV